MLLVLVLLLVSDVEVWIRIAFSASRSCAPGSGLSRPVFRFA